MFKYKALSLFVQYDESRQPRVLSRVRQSYKRLAQTVNNLRQSIVPVLTKLAVSSNFVALYKVQN